MPLLLPTTELEPGMKLHAPLTAGGRVLLQAGKELTPADIEILRRRMPDGSIRIEDPVLDAVIEFDDDARDRKVANDVQTRVAQSMSHVQSRFSDRTALKGNDYAGLEAAVHELMQYLKENPTSAASVMECLDPNSYFATHTGNVFYLSMVLATTALDYIMQERQRQTNVKNLAAQQAKDLLPLGLAAMVMDLGMLPLQDIVKKNKPLTDEESEAVRRHPITSAELLPESFSSVTRMVVRTHHENVAGCGYPQGIPGNRVHIFSRLVRITDAFCAATSPRAYRGAKSHARALWEMTLGPYRRFYDQKLLTYFASVIQPFPIGAKLKLKDGRYAVVVKHNRRSPFLPAVIIAFDAENRAIPKNKLEKPFSLAGANNVRVANFRGEDLAFLYSRDEREPTASQKFGTALAALYP